MNTLMNTLMNTFTKTLVKIYQRFKIYIALAFISTTLSACANNIIISAPKTYSQNGVYFDTLINVTIYDSSKEHADLVLNKCFKLCEKYENLFDERNPSSDISRLNNSKTNEIILDHETITLLQAGLQFSAISNGRFDITIYPVSSLWDFHEATAHRPLDEEINDALSHVDYTKLKLDSSNNSASFSDPKSCVDTGGIAKGYISDRIAEYLSSEGISAAIINIGGEIKLIGSKPDSSKYHIGITDPFNTNETILGLSLDGNTAVATSGTYERVITIDNKSYHHILDSSTGYPAKTDLVSATIICENAVDADTLCTISIIYGSNDAIDFLENIDNTEGILVKENGEIVMTSNASQYIKQ